MTGATYRGEFIQAYSSRVHHHHDGEEWQHADMATREQSERSRLKP